MFTLVRPICPCGCFCVKVEVLLQQASRNKALATLLALVQLVLAQVSLKARDLAETPATVAAVVPADTLLLLAPRTGQNVPPQARPMHETPATAPTPVRLVARVDVKVFLDIACRGKTPATQATPVRQFLRVEQKVSLHGSWLATLPTEPTLVIRLWGEGLRPMHAEVHFQALSQQKRLAADITLVWPGCSNRKELHTQMHDQSEAGAHSHEATAELATLP